MCYKCLEQCLTDYNIRNQTRWLGAVTVKAVMGVMTMSTIATPKSVILISGASSTYGWQKSENIKWKTQEMIL